MLRCTTEKSMARADWWPIDRVILAYFGATTAVELACWSRLPNPWELLIVHLAGALLIVAAVARPLHDCRATSRGSVSVFRHWYPVFYVFYCYKKMSILIPALRSTDADAALAQFDFDIWGAHPCVWLERISSPLLTEALQIVYSGFVPVVLLMGLILLPQSVY